MTTTESPLMRKIRLLMAKAQGTDNEHEAATFAAKVQELLLENNLSASDIKMSNGDNRETVGQHDQANGKDFLRSPARRALLMAVCKFYMCSYLRWGNERVVIVGKPSNAEVAASMMNYLLNTVVRLSNNYASGSARIDFRRGCMLQLTNRLYTLTREREQAATQPANTLPALFVSENELVKQYMATIKTKKARSTTIKQGIHAMAGRQAADGISLHGQIGSTNKPQRRLA